LRREVSGRLVRSADLGVRGAAHPLVIGGRPLRATGDTTVGYALAVTGGPSAGASAGDRTTFSGPSTDRRLGPEHMLVSTKPVIEHG
jgi:hypothetical protein